MIITSKGAPHARTLDSVPGGTFYNQLIGTDVGFGGHRVHLQNPGNKFASGWNGQGGLIEGGNVVAAAVEIVSSEDEEVAVSAPVIESARQIVYFGIWEWFGKILLLVFFVEIYCNAWSYLMSDVFII